MNASIDLGPRTSSIVAWIERAVGESARVVGIGVMPRSSTEKHVVEVALGEGPPRRLVLRRYHDAARLESDPWYVPANEALALDLLAASVVPAPRLLAADLEAAVCDVPALLESWIAGATLQPTDDLDRYLARSAEALVEIHAVRVPAHVRLPGYATYRRTEPISSPAFSTRPGLWERVNTFLDPPGPAHTRTFIHRDYHPGNILWDGARLTGVVDWATAAWGPPGIDLARMRLNLAMTHGATIADRFTEAYVTAGGDRSARDRYWDLLDAADALLDAAPASPADADDWGRFEGYVERLLAERQR